MLERVLKDPSLLKSYREFGRGTSHSDNFNFHQSVCRFRLLGLDDDKRDAKANQICEKFIRVGSRHEIDLDPVVRKRTLGKICDRTFLEIPPNPFEEAMACVWRRLVNSMGDFRRSDAYQDLKANEANKRPNRLLFHFKKNSCNILLYI